VHVWRRFTRGVTLAAVWALASSRHAGAAGSEAEEQAIKAIEQQRLRALVTADMSTARRLHSDDFLLITPSGSELTKDSYLTQIESGTLDYRAWEPGPITVRLYGNVAVIRYDDMKFEVFDNGQMAWTGAVRKVRHMNLYEKRNGQWQVVWSQASGGQPPGGR